MARKKVLVPLPNRDFDPTEVAVPWKILREQEIDVVFATPTGGVPEADPVMVTGRGLGPLKFEARADRNGRRAYRELVESGALAEPLRYDQLAEKGFDAILLPGGHAPGMREYLESEILHALVARFFEADKPVAAICHGVVLAARSGKLHGRRTTALPRWMELLAWGLTRLWMGGYYRTYPKTTVQDEVEKAVGSRALFVRGPRTLRRDSPESLGTGFVIRDGSYLSARWPGDAHRFGHELVGLLAASG